MAQHMITIKRRLTEKEVNIARRTQGFRDRCKDYLERHGVLYDKFTITPYDAYIAYITEKFIANYLRDEFKGKICVSTWSDQFNLEHIVAILDRDSADPEDIALVKAYFYDDFDLYVSTPCNSYFIKLKVDVKTAITENIPRKNWEFLYPVVQAKKPGKDAVILVYYIADDDQSPSSLKELSIVGYLTEDEISKCNIVKKGERTSHGTKSQIDNYETHVDQYHELINLFSGIKDR